MNVGMLVNNLAVSGGYQKLVLRLGRELEALGHTVTIYTLHLDRGHCYPEDIDALTIRALSDGPLPEITAWSRLAALVDRDHDALVLHDEASLHVLGALDGYRGRVVWMLNNELSFPTKSMDFKDLARQVVATRRPRPTSAVLVEAARDVRARRTLRRAARRVNAFAVYDSRNLAAVKQYLGREATLVFAGADIDDFEEIAASRPVETTTDTFHVVSVGVVFPHRRYEDLIEALVILGRDVPVHLTIVGLHTLHPRYSSALRTQVTGLGLDDRVSFREYVEPDELADLYRRADAFAFVNDGLTWGIAAFEAVAAGVPLVLSATAGASDLLLDGRHAWIVPPRDPNAIAAALMEIYRSPEEGRRRLQAARDEVLDVVRWPAFAARIDGLLR
jgi:glycosyltransferase involved in cell wall biosynthesis